MIDILTYNDLVKNVCVYGLSESVKASKYPMAVNTEQCTADITDRTKTLACCTKGTGHDQFLTGIIEAVGGVMTHGAEKYGEGSYRKVHPKRYRAALMRHICKWLKNPHGVDEDSGLPHLWHIACNVAFLLELDKEEQKRGE